MKIKINKNVLLLIAIIIIETIVVKTFMYQVLPEKYFYDSRGIFNLLGNTSNIIDISRKFTVAFFSKINIFGFTTINQWGWLISIVFTTIIIKYILQNKKYNLFQTIFIIMSIALLNIYVFCISKDIIQFIIFLIIFLILKSKKSNNFKIIASIITLIFEALVFRVYYLIMALLIFTIYFIYKMFVEKKKIEKKNIIKLVIVGIIFFFAEVFILQKISLENYNSIMYARSSVNIDRINALDAETLIYELFGDNNNFIIFVLNYITVFIRMLFPFELLFKGFKYIPFIIYQLFITFNILKYRKKLNSDNMVWLIVVVSFFMTSAIFEPDFGSFIRHESTMFLIFLQLFMLGDKEKESVKK